MLNILKRDLVSLSSVFLPYLCIMILLAAAFSVSVGKLQPMLIVSYGLIALLDTALPLITLLSCARLFHKRVISNEAYLNMTLPIRPWVYTLSNFISVSVWFFIAHLVSGTVYLYSLRAFASAASLSLDLSETLKDLLSLFLSYYLYIIVLIGIVYFSLMLASRMSKSTLPMAFLFFMIFFSITLGVASVGLALFESNYGNAYSGSADMASYDIIPAAIAVTVFAAYFTIANYILCRKYNLK